MEILDRLDNAQRESVLAGEGLVRVRAGAGTGKTTVLTTRIVHLVKERGQDPARIVATTFTNKAAKEMSERTLALGGVDVQDVVITTLHALACSILRECWDLAGFVAPRFTIADESESQSMIRDCIDESDILGPKPEKRDTEFEKIRNATVKEITRKIGRWKENGLTIEQVQDPNRSRRSMKDEDAALIYVAYQEKLRQQNMADFGDLTILAVRVLEENPDVLDEVSDYFQWFMVDEFQDTNLIQLRFVELLASKHRNLMVVGDDDQSLYSFRGAVPNMMDRIHELVPDIADKGITDCALITNRRCTDEILAPANLLVDYNTRLEPKVLESGRSGSPVSTSAYPSDVAEAKGVVAMIEELVDTGVAPEEIAVLGRTSHVLNGIEQPFEKTHVPYSMQAGTAFHQRSEVLDVIAYMKLAVNPRAAKSFERIAAKPPRGLGTAAVEAIVSMADAGNGYSIHEALSAFASSPGLKANAREGAAELARHLRVLEAAVDQDEDAETVIRYIMNDTGYYDWLFGQKEVPKRAKASMQGILDRAQEAEGIRAFIDDMALRSEQEDRSDDGVHIGTMHGSKGLEWDHVFVVGFEAGIIPNQKALDEESQIDISDPWVSEGGGGLEEERRLAHVALTRARHTAHVSMAGARRQGPKFQQSKPSMFFNEAELGVPKVSQRLADLKVARKKKARPIANYGYS